MKQNPRQKIIRVATECFLKYGIKGTTTDIIASEAGISKRTLYLCFWDKYDLLRVCVHTWFETNIQAIRSRIACMESMEAILFMHRMVYDLFTAPYPAFCRDMAKSYDLKEYLEAEYLRPLELIAAALFERAKADGLITEETDVAKTLFLFERFVLSVSQEPCDDRQREAVFSYAIRVFLTGLCTDLGRQRLMNIDNKRTK